MAATMRLTSLTNALFPPECLSCTARVDRPFSLCGICWSATGFIFGSHCDRCGIGLPGQISDGSDPLVCEACLKSPPPWNKGRAVFHYSETGRRLVLALKHGDRPDIARAAGPWMARVGGDILQPDSVIVPMPLHWTRLVRRRFNQSILLARALADHGGWPCAPRALTRVRPTPSQDGRDRAARFENLADAIAPNPRFSAVLEGASVMLVDDVFTSGASFAAATAACLRAGAENVSVLALARVGPDR